RWAIAAKNISVKASKIYYYGDKRNGKIRSWTTRRNNHLSNLSASWDQLQTDAVKAFWLNINLEKAEIERQLSETILGQKLIELRQKEVDIELSKAEFVIRHSMTGNKGHELLNNQKLKYMKNLDDDEEIELGEPSTSKSRKRKPVRSNDDLTETDKTDDSEYFPSDNDTFDPSDSSCSDHNHKKASNINQKIDKGKKRADVKETRSINICRTQTRNRKVLRTPSPRSTNKANLIITPEKPSLSEKSAQYIHNHIAIKTNEQHAILKTEGVSIKIPDAIYNWLVKTIKKEFKTAIMVPFEPEECENLHHFRQICESVLYDLIVPLFKALQSEYPEYKFSWIEFEVKSIREIAKVFPGFDLIINKADGIGTKVSCDHAVVFIEVSGRPGKQDETHIEGDAEKLLKEATFGLVSLLRNYLDKPAEVAKNVH
ncbi:15728_t:CDS:10, partial [Acaulospora morrowiae]